MLLAEVECLFIGFIMCVSGVQGQAKIICALKGSSVDLPCSAEDPTKSRKWYTEHWDGTRYVLNEFSPDGNRTTYNTSEESNFTLTIRDVRESDEKFYCCGNIPGNRLKERGRTFCSTKLHITDLQVKVIPTTEGHTVTLMCSTSCALTENPAAYIWYKNRESLYQDWSPWYQELVSSEEAVRYSCAVKGYEHLRAPEVSVDSVTSTCFNVTYAEGRMCSYKPTSEDEPCSITYPTEVHVQRTPLADGYVRLTCTPSCPLTHPQMAYRWYRNKYLYRHSEIQHLTIHDYGRSNTDDVSCAVKGHEDLLSAEVCDSHEDCWSENYVSRRICALEGSSVNISSTYTYSEDIKWQPMYKCWYKIKRSSKDAEKLTEDTVHPEYRDNMKDILRINNLKKNDSAEYKFRFQRQCNEGWKLSNFPGVTLVVTGLKVTISPSAVVTEGQRVTLSCSTSCPLTDNTNYIWYLNSRPLTLIENQNKHLVLDPVSSQHAGNYSCAVKTQKDIRSPEETLTVALGKSMAEINVLRLTVATLIPVPLLLFHLWMRWTRSMRT